MLDMLGFNPNRELGFDPERELGFSPGRRVDIDPGRRLAFDHDRDLGFGKRGIVFRGFVCPVCGASVTPDQPSCTDCGAVFERKAPPKISKPLPPAPAAPPKAAPPRTTPPLPPPPPPPTRAPPGRMYPPPPKRIDIVNCPHCAARVSATDAFCWNCGNRTFASPRG